MMGGGRTNDLWGWTDPLTGKEYGLVGRTTGTSFLDLSNPGAPVYLGNLPTHSQASTWRGIKVYGNHAFIISEAAGHGLQVFDLTQLRGVAAPPVTFAETAHYAGFSRAHTVAVNAETGFLYAVGSNTCAGGLHMVDVSTPAVPVFAGCFSADKYTHETQCVLYQGPDARYRDREICFNSNEDTLTIVDVTNKAAPAMLARKTYPGRGYTHQGWLNADHRYFLLDDETDETKLKTNSRTHVFDVSDLRAPQVVGIYEGASTAIDHNQYVSGNHTFQSNYASGLRVLGLDGIANAKLREIAFFDVRPEDDKPDYIGSWTNYPFFNSGIVIVGSIERGLFVLRPNLSPLSGADLVVSELSSTAVTGAGASLFVTDVTRNQGATPVPETHTELYLSSDGSFDGTDQFIGERHIGALGGDEEDSGSTLVTIPPDTASGAYYILAISDPHQDAPEEIENNNARPRFIRVGADLTVTALKAPAIAARGAQISITDTTKNAGGADAIGTVTRFVLSKDKRIDLSDVELATHTVPALEPSQTHTGAATIVIPSSVLPGVYRLIAIADLNQEVDEFDETNNDRIRKITIQ
jgi:choice-of-anchor B domain-containing protein